MPKLLIYTKEVQTNTTAVITDNEETATTVQLTQILPKMFMTLLL